MAATNGSISTSARNGAPPPPVPPDPSFVGRLILRGKRIAERKSVKHLIRAITRYGERLGSQFAGAMTYFSFLSLVPILMVGFAVGGIVLANNQELLTELENQVAELLPADLAEPITDLIDSVVANPLGVGIVGLLIALYSGIGWMGNLRKATTGDLAAGVRRRTSHHVDNIVVATVKDLGSLAGLGVAIVVSLGLSTFGAQFATQILDWLGLSDQPWLGPVVTVITLLIAMAADVLIFMWVYTVLPGQGVAVPVEGPAAWFDPGRRRVRDPEVRVDRPAARRRDDVQDGGDLRPRHRPAVLLQPRRADWCCSWRPGSRRPTAARRLDDGPLPEVPEATMVVRKDASPTTAVALVGVGAAVGWGAARRRR